MVFELKNTTGLMPKKTLAMPTFNIESNASIPNGRASGSRWPKAVNFEKKCFCELLTATAQFGLPPLGTYSISSCCHFPIALFVAWRKLKFGFAIPLWRFNLVTYLTDLHMLIHTWKELTEAFPCHLQCYIRIHTWPVW
jgi:hypothetical protein